MRAVNDTVDLFVATEFVLDPTAKISRIAFKELFERWCEEEGVQQKISKKTRMKPKGIAPEQ